MVYDMAHETIPISFKEFNLTLTRFWTLLAFGAKYGWFTEPTRTWQGDTRVTVTSNYSGCSYVVTRRGREGMCR